MGHALVRGVQNPLPDRHRDDQLARGGAARGREFRRHLQHLVDAAVKDGRRRRAVGGHGKRRRNRHRRHHRRQPTPTHLHPAVGTRVLAAEPGSEPARVQLKDPETDHQEVQVGG